MISFNKGDKVYINQVASIGHAYSNYKYGTLIRLDPGDTTFPYLVSFKHPDGYTKVFWVRENCVYKHWIQRFIRFSHFLEEVRSLWVVDDRQLTVKPYIKSKFELWK